MAFWCIAVAPHFDGSWEHLIQSAKSMFRTILDCQTVANKILHSAFVGATALMNVCPVEYGGEQCKSSSSISGIDGSREDRAKTEVAIGRVTKIFPGPDGAVLSASVAIWT